MLTLYDNIFSCNGYKARLLLSHLGLPVRVVAVDIFAGESRQPGFLARNPAGRIPVLELEDGRCIPESGAILWHLARDTAFGPAGAAEEVELLRWMFFEQNLVECTIGTARYLLNHRPGERPDVVAHRQETARDALAVLERHLDGRQWLAAGRFTIADIAVFGYASVAEEAGLSLDGHPRVVEWRRRVVALPGHVGPDWGFTEQADTAGSTS